MRELLCRWSILLDKRAARDARVLNASPYVQSYHTFVDSIYEEQQRNIEICTREASFGETSSQNNGLNYS
eukprot:3900241-Prorocentrum_lima.AAC.1